MSSWIFSGDTLPVGVEPRLDALLVLADTEETEAEREGGLETDREPVQDDG